ncbi:MAG: flippase-like domain-containing protein [Saprospiraceae bacterium]|nr:flippase-like domain-containing protein [Saprospiraceae bacterium]
MKKGLLTSVKFLFFLSLGIVLVWLSIKDLSPSERNDIWESFKSAKYSWVILCIILGLLSHLIRARRWRRLLRPMGYNPSLKNTFYAVMIGYLANMAFPRLGEVTRCGILNRYEKIPINKALGTVITERALDLLVFFILFFITIVTQYNIINNYLQNDLYPKISEKFSFFAVDHLVGYLLLTIVIVIVLLFIIFKKRLEKSKIYIKIKELLFGFWQGLKSLTQLKKPTIFILETMAIWVLYFLMIYLCFFCFPETSKLGLGVGLAVLVLGSFGIMVTPGGIGLYPIIVSATLLLYFVPKSTGLALGWISWSAQTLMILIFGSLSLILLSFNKRKNESTGDNQI